MKDAKEIWFDSIAAQCPGAEEEVITLELSNALRSFCTKSLAWQEELGPYTAIAGETLNVNDSGTDTLGNYPADYNAKVVQTIELEVDGVWGYSVSNRDPDAGTTNNIQNYYMNGPNLIIFQPEFSTNQTDLVNIRAALTPNSCDAEVPDYFETLFFDGILSGTLYKLLNYQKKPYTDPVIARSHGGIFSSAISYAKFMAKKKFGTSDPQWRYPIAGWQSPFRQGS